MSATRRQVLRMVPFGGAVFALSGPNLIVRPALAADQIKLNFVALIDTLVPSEDEIPGALALGIELTIVRAGWLKRKSIQQGCRWLELMAKRNFGKSFQQLDYDDRAAIVGIAEMADRSSGAHRFFQLVRHRVMALYYAHPRGWSAMGYNGPPQPEGYLDYDVAPAKTR